MIGQWVITPAKYTATRYAQAEQTNNTTNRQKPIKQNMTDKTNELNPDTHCQPEVFYFFSCRPTKNFVIKKEIKKI